MLNKRDLTSPCGLDCFNCEIHEDNITNEMAEFIHSKAGIPLEEISCKGCRQQDGVHYHLPSEGCATLTCAKAKGVEFCCDCDDFPCDHLHPYADQATMRPHNTKVFNLCLIKKMGLESWAKDKAKQVKDTYFKGKFTL